MSTQIAFKTLGGTGADCVLIHGFASDRMSWAANASSLMSVARVHSLDLPAHGESHVDVSDGSLGYLANSVADAIAAHGIERAHFVGHSLGAGVAIALAAREPQRVRSLSLIAPIGLGHGVDKNFVHTLTQATEIDATLALLRSLVERPNLINKLFAKRLLDHLARQGVRDALAKIGTQLEETETKDVPQLLAKTNASIPKLVLWGDADKINPPSISRLAKYGIDPVMFEACGHLPHIEKAEVVNRLLTSFIQQSMGV